jgi:ribulose kinase
MSENQKSFYIGVDVGTASVRAALVSEAGVVIKKTSKQIKINNPKQGTNQ